MCYQVAKGAVPVQRLICGAELGAAAVARLPVRLRWRIAADFEQCGHSRRLEDAGNVDETVQVE